MTPPTIWANDCGFASGSDKEGKKMRIQHREMYNVGHLPKFDNFLE
jgi:hypothetical protein